MRNMVKEVNGLTQDQIENIRQGLGEYATSRRFVARRGKEPIDPRTGYGAKANDPSTWAPLDQALEAVDKYNLDGIGVELGDGLCGIDIDHCINEKGEVSEKAEEIVSAMDSYIETSPSGTGMHILFTGSILDGARRKDGLEMYAEGRYFTLTGEGSGTVADRTEQAALVHKKYMSSKESVQISRTAPTLIDLSDREPDDVLLEKMFAAKNGTAITALWNGDTSAYGGDDSRADSALIMHLAFWTHGDTKRIDQLFRISGLMRPKWDEQHGVQTYGELTISRALEAQRSYAVKRDFAPVTDNYSVRIGKQSQQEPASTDLVVIDPLEDEKRYTWDDMGNGYLFADTYRNKYRYVPEAGSWYYFNSQVWVIDMGNIIGAEFAKQLVKLMGRCAWNIKEDGKREEYLHFVAKLSSNKVREAMLVSARSVYPVPLAEFDKFPFLFNCQNGTLDLQTMSFNAHRAENFLSKISNVIYEPKIRCERWDQFIVEIMQNDIGKARFLQKALGYALTGDTSQECFFILYGATSRNGKGTLCETIKYLMGAYARAAQPETIGQKQNTNGGSGPSEDIARLKGARFVNISEPDKGLRLNAALVKQLTGGDSVAARFLHQNSFEYIPEFKIFINCNYLPKVADDTIFKSGRVKLIPFERHFEPNEQDKGLKASFRKPENITGIFNWLTEGLKILRDEGLEAPDAVTVATEEYREESDVIGLFIQGCMSPYLGEKIKTTVAYETYTSWCHNNGYKPLNQHNFMDELRKKVELERNGHMGNYIADYKMITSYY